jgi:hypothetical protein
MEDSNTYTLKNRVRQLFLKDLFLLLDIIPKHNTIEIFFDYRNIWFTEVAGAFYIRPLAIQIKDARRGIIRLIYKKEIDDLMDKANPLFRDVFIGNNGFFHDNWNNGINILMVKEERNLGKIRYDWGVIDGTFIMPDDRNAKVIEILTEKYGTKTEPKRGEIYRVREIARKHVKDKAIRTIKKFLRAKVLQR